MIDITAKHIEMETKKAEASRSEAPQSESGLMCFAPVENLEELPEKFVYVPNPISVAG